MLCYAKEPHFVKAEKLEKMLAFLTGGASMRSQHVEQAMLLNAALATMCDILEEHSWS